MFTDQNLPWTTFLKPLLAGLGALAMVSCQKPPAEPIAESSELSEERKAQILEEGNQASDALMKSLGGKLKAALATGKPVTALTICQQLAQPTTEQISANLQGKRISRISLKTRNPSNDPNPEDRALLEQWENRLSGGESALTSEVQMRADGVAVFYRPIMIQEVCLKCHGAPATFGPELSSELAKLYPEDRANGYQLGDLRGAFRVEFPLSTP